MSPARRALTDYQWIILWEIADHPSAVWCRSVDLWIKSREADAEFTKNFEWFIELAGKSVKITHQVWGLVNRGLIRQSAEGEDDPVYVTGAGHAALAARDYFQVIDRYNSR